MHWKQADSQTRELADSEIASELLEGLERLSADATLLRIRFRWRPHGSQATGFETKDHLLGLETASNVQIASELSSHARDLWSSGLCESRFEAQVQRQLTSPVDEDDDTPPVRDWRSITFYVAEPTAPTTKAATPVTNSFHEPDDDFDDGDDGDDGDDDDGFDDDEPVEPVEPVTRPRPRHVPPRPRPRPEPPTSRATFDAELFGAYAGYVELARTDPQAFAMLITLKSGDRTVDTLERLLYASFDRFDRTLEQQGSHNQFINEALQTLTSGSGELASVGVDLFRNGLHQQASVIRLNHDTEIGKERTELMRDAVKQGSLLIQAVLMSNAAKRRQSPEQTSTDTQPTKPSAPTPTQATKPNGPTPTPAEPPQPRRTLSPEDAELAAADDRYIETRTRQLLEQLTPDKIDALRPHAPTLAPVLDRLRSRPITAAWVRQVVRDAQAETDPNELHVLGAQLDPEVSAKFSAVIMRALSGDLA